MTSLTDIRGDSLERRRQEREAAEERERERRQRSAFYLSALTGILSKISEISPHSISSPPAITSDSGEMPRDTRGEPSRETHFSAPLKKALQGDHPYLMTILLGPRLRAEKQRYQRGLNAQYWDWQEKYDQWKFYAQAEYLIRFFALKQFFDDYFDENPERRNRYPSMRAVVEQDISKGTYGRMKGTYGEMKKRLDEQEEEMKRLRREECLATLPMPAPEYPGILLSFAQMLNEDEPDLYGYLTSAIKRVRDRAQGSTEFSYYSSTITKDEFKTTLKEKTERIPDNALTFPTECNPFQEQLARKEVSNNHHDSKVEHCLKQLFGSVPSPSFDIVYLLSNTDYLRNQSLGQLNQYSVADLQRRYQDYQQACEKAKKIYREEALPWIRSYLNLFEDLKLGNTAEDILQSIMDSKISEASWDELPTIEGKPLLQVVLEKYNAAPENRSRWLPVLERIVERGGNLTPDLEGLIREWRLVHLFLDSRLTHSRLEENARRGLLRYIDRTEQQLSGFFMRMFIDPQIKNSHRLTTVGQLTTGLCQTTPEGLSALTHALSSINPDMTTGWFGHSELKQILEGVNHDCAGLLEAPPSSHSSTTEVMDVKGVEMNARKMTFSKSTTIPLFISKKNDEEEENKSCADNFSH